MRIAFSSLVCLSLSAIQPSTFASCPITLQAGGSPATVDITVAWASEPYDGNQTAPAYFTDQVTDTNAEIPSGPYLGWCIDVTNAIGAGPTSYSSLLFSSCDPNLNSELEALDYQYPGTVYVGTQVWNEINYILNNTGGANFYTIQVAIWNLIGGPTDPTQLASLLTRHGPRAK
jgi:hypothetical protein